MPSCQAFNCTNQRGKCLKSFFKIPDPTKSLEKRKLCMRWINNLKNGKLTLGSYNSYKYVCEDHFTPESFVRNSVAESLDFKPKYKKLVANAVPTIIRGVQTTPASARVTKERSSSHQQKRKNAQIKEALLSEAKKRKISEKTSTKPRDPPTDKTFCQSEEHGVLTGQDTNHVTLVPEPCNNLTLCQEEILSSKPKSCGHPCLMCFQAMDMQASLCTADHSYHRMSGPSVRSVGVNTDGNLDPVDKGVQVPSEDKSDHIHSFSTTNTQPASTNIDVLTSDEMGLSTPNQTLLKLPQCTSTPMKYLHETSFLEDSFKSYSFRDDSRDMTFHHIATDEDTDSEDSEVGENDLVQQPKFIVFEQQLDRLFSMMKCNKCSCPVDPSDIHKDTSSGSMLRASIYCTNGHLIDTWTSQPLIGKMPAGNLLISAATLFSGQTYTHIAQFCNFMNLLMIGKTTFNNIQREILMPVVQHTWDVLQEKVLDDIKTSNRPLRLAGDGRCDSPGFSAKYCTYSLLDMETNRIVTFDTVKVTETGGSSTKMEVEGFRRCMDFLLDRGFQIEILATDRHIQIRHLMTKHYPDTEHQFDVWHLANSLQKKLQQKAKLKGMDDLGPWIKAVCNHLWWCANNCHGDKDLLEERWTSIVHHVVNKHDFDGDVVTSCAHEEISPEEARKKKWLKQDSQSHNALKEVILNKRLRKDVRHLSEFCHTGSLEVYHSLLTKYVPKRQEFDDDQMKIRTTLAAIDHNMSQNRGLKLDVNGECVYRTMYSKATKKWVAKPVYNDKKYNWVHTMMKLCVTQKESMLLPKIPVKPRGNIAPIPAPRKADLVKNLISRFDKTCD